MSASVRKGFDWAIVLFFALAYAIAWGVIPLLARIAAASGLAGWVELGSLAESGELRSVALSAPRWVVHLLTRIQDFAFSIAGVVTIARVSGREGLRELARRLVRTNVPGQWWLFALFPFGLYVIALLFAGATSPMDLSIGTLGRVLVCWNGGLLTTLLLRGPMGEEIGLRGFALPRLQRRLSPFWSSLLIGVLWAAWHIPVLAGRDPLSIGAILIVAISLSFAFTLLFNGSGGSLVPVLILHTAQNTEGLWEAMFPGLSGTDWELIATVGAALIGVICAIGMALSRMDEKQKGLGGRLGQ